jgi:16S rRNA (cytosine1402-N4)-methyltransferase
MEVNNELWVIKDSLFQAFDLLETWWRIAVITFHSVEDRTVKHVFAEYLKEIRDDFTWKTLEKPLAIKITKKPILPTITETKTNPRSRSAKLRVIEKII